MTDIMEMTIQELTDALNDGTVSLLEVLCAVREGGSKSV